MTPEAQARVAELSLEQVPAAEDAVKQRQLAACFERCWNKFIEASPEHALVISWIAEDRLSREQIAALLGAHPGRRASSFPSAASARLYLADWYALAFLEG